MSIALTHYAKVRNHYCLSYSGRLPDYVVLLRTIRPHLRTAYPELRLFISCRDELMYLMESEEDVIPYSTLHDRKYEFAYIREISTSVNPPHSILSLIEESIPGFKSGPVESKTSGRWCLVCPDGGLPTKGFPNSQKLKSYAEAKGYRAIVLGSDLHPGSAAVDSRPGQDKLAYLLDADWVIGVENEYLFEAVRRNIKTTLVPTGIGTNLYKLLCPHGEIMTL